MRIPSRVYSQAAGPLTQRQDQNESPQEPAAVQRARTAEDVRVAVSSQAKELATADGIDEVKVSQLRAAIEAGAFTIDAARIADAIAKSGG